MESKGSYDSGATLFGNELVTTELHICLSF